MNIYSPKGTKVVYTAAGCCKEHVCSANEYLTIGESYFVDFVDVWSHHADVYLTGFSKGFDAGMFDNLVEG